MIYNTELEKGDGEGNLLLVAVVLFIKKLFLFNMRVFLFKVSSKQFCS